MTTSGKSRDIAPATGKLGVLLPGMGSVATLRPLAPPR